MTFDGQFYTNAFQQFHTLYMSAWPFTMMSWCYDILPNLHQCYSNIICPSEKLFFSVNLAEAQTIHLTFWTVTSVQNASTKLPRSPISLSSCPRWIVKWNQHHHQQPQQQQQPSTCPLVTRRQLVKWEALECQSAYVCVCVCVCQKPDCSEWTFRKGRNGRWYLTFIGASSQINNKSNMYFS